VPKSVFGDQKKFKTAKKFLSRTFGNECFRAYCHRQSIKSRWQAMCSVESAHTTFRSYGPGSTTYKLILTCQHKQNIPQQRARRQRTRPRRSSLAEARRWWPPCRDHTVKTTPIVCVLRPHTRLTEVLNDLAKSDEYTQIDTQRQFCENCGRLRVRSLSKPKTPNAPTCRTHTVT